MSANANLMQSYNVCFMFFICFIFKISSTNFKLWTSKKQFYWNFTLFLGTQFILNLTSQSFGTFNIQKKNIWRKLSNRLRENRFIGYIHSASCVCMRERKTEFIIRKKSQTVKSICAFNECNFKAFVQNFKKEKTKNVI